jgi:hypothetical protein
MTCESVMERYSFFVRIYAAGASPHEPSPLAITFETAFQQLADLPGMFIEPDGSFVWRKTQSENDAWQLDGNLFDRGASLFYVEVKGSCPREAFDQLLTAIRGATVEFAFEWVDRGQFMNEPTFRNHAACTK